jgi:hypothetical protein
MPNFLRRALWDRLQSLQCDLAFLSGSILKDIQEAEVINLSEFITRFETLEAEVKLQEMRLRRIL